MAFIRIILLLFLITPAMFFLSGCYDDSFLKAMKEEDDFIAPFDVVLSDDDDVRTVYFAISDTSRSEVVLPGDDASYSNIPAAPNFSERNVDNGTDTDDVIDDSVTGLTWLKCTAIDRNIVDTADDCSGVSTKLSWSHAAETCSKLEYAGHDDWRLPSASELFSILHFNEWPLVDTAGQFFPDTKTTVGDGYWTSTSKLFIEFNANYDSFDVNDYAWIVFFGGGGVWGVNLTDLKEKIVYDEDTGITTIEKQFVRCVRGGR